MMRSRTNQSSLIVSDTVPKPGDKLSIDDCDMIVEAIERRQENFPEEKLGISVAVVLFNIGNRFAPVYCINGEWKGLKKDIPKREGGGVPLCPNGHVMTEGPSLCLGWRRE